MSAYVCSDIHGCYEQFKGMLDVISFSDEDTLYILGDVIDRGLDGIAILQDIIRRNNVELIIGNHELMMLKSLDAIKRLEQRGLTYQCSRDASNWVDYNGGHTTYSKFTALTEEEQNKIVDYLKDRPVIKVIEVNGSKFHLSHSFTIPNREKDAYFIEDLTASELDDVVWRSPFRYDRLFVSSEKYSETNLRYIVGHVPTYKLHNREEPKIIRQGNIIDIDCGCVHGRINSALSCLRLDDGKAYYIRNDDTLSQDKVIALLESNITE